MVKIQKNLLLVPQCDKFIYLEGAIIEQNGGFELDIASKKT